ncbi:MAG TPA: iron-containing alcohol dehydrogenase [Candidatus Hydrogenedentes bacterium]|nr:iron-containing alcohol dehydrogenase [Candidatus Hydrogenedentota bacterium]
MISAFNFARMPQVIFGPGKSSELPRLIRKFGSRVLVVTGDASYKSLSWDRFQDGLKTSGIEHSHITLKGEPSPEFVDDAVAQFAPMNLDVVVAWGGGSVIDAGKAISAMLMRKEPVAEYLETVGTKTLPDGSKKPFIAVPTTAGTGSEATKNAVLSRIGRNGFKKSLRHDNFVPDIALVDPELMLHCPAAVTAACGMDAFTQLLEAYVSSAASPMTDALAWSGIEAIARSLVPACSDGAGDAQVRADMAYAALMSGIVLANAGLGVVHGLASPIGGYAIIPHGVVCGTLMAPAVAVTIQRLSEAHGPGHPALKKYARVGALLAGTEETGTLRDCRMLVEHLEALTEQLAIPTLNRYGFSESDIPNLLAGAENKNNPIALNSEDISLILQQRLS